MAEEGVDEFGPSSDGSELAADQDLELVEAGGGMVARLLLTTIPDLSADVQEPVVSWLETGRNKITMLLLSARRGCTAAGRGRPVAACWAVRRLRRPGAGNTAPGASGPEAASVAASR